MMPSPIHINLKLSTSLIIYHDLPELTAFTQHHAMEIYEDDNITAADYWPMAREFSIWNAAIASLQFWTADLDPATLGTATERIYNNFFYTPTRFSLQQLADDVLFARFVIALNAAFTQQLTLADEGYESGTENSALPTPLRQVPRIHHVSTTENASFDPTHVTPQRPPHTPPRPVRRRLSFSSPAPSPTTSDTEDEEDFQTVPLDDVHWTTEEVPIRTFCVHEHGHPLGRCPRPCPWANLNDNQQSYLDIIEISDISDYEDYMVVSSDEEELPGLIAVPY